MRIDIEIVCKSDEVYKNETDEELAKNRAEAGDEGYDADMCFSVFINNGCILCHYGLFGLDVQYTFRKNVDAAEKKAVLMAIDTVSEWFNDKTLDDICEKMYHEIETDLCKLIADRIESEIG